MKSVDFNLIISPIDNLGFPQKHLIILSGIPGSGKTSIATRLAEHGYVIVSADKIRGELYGDEGEQGNPAEVFRVFDQKLFDTMRKERKIVIDNCNCKGRDRNDLERRGKANGFQVDTWILDTPLEIAIQRNSERVRKVPVHIIEAMYKNLTASHKGPHISVNTRLPVTTFHYNPGVKCSV